MLPNLLCYFRIILIPLIYYLLVKDNSTYHIIAFVLIFLGIQSDVLDGYLARRLNQVTDLGKILDPLSDKMALFVFLLFTMIHRDFPIWAGVSIIIKDFLTLSFGLYYIRKKGLVPFSDRWGKYSTHIWAFCVLFYLFRIDYLKQISLGLGLILIPVSVYFYLKNWAVPNLFKRSAT